MVLLGPTVKNIASKLGSIVSRKKTEDPDPIADGSPTLPRVLGFFDLTLLGVGSTLGVGVYVLAGEVAKNNAGPAVTLSFLVAAVASAFAGLCYAEFAARVPKAGSAYVYSYVTVGELCAFVIGWNLILEYVIGTASVARAFSSYLDVLVNNTIQNHLREVMPINVSFLSGYPDFLALGIILLLTGVLAYGVKESALMNNIFTAINLVTVAIVIICGFIKANPSYWYITKAEAVKNNGGEGGFLPYGMPGVMAGAAKCFFGFIGFDCVATTGEEANNPHRNIPLAIVASLVVIFLSYFGISAVVTMMVPYYNQDVGAPLVYAFKHVDMPVISTIVSIGAIFALCTSLLGCVFPLPRVLYAMGNDGLIHSFFCTVNQKTQTPFNSTVVAGLLAGSMFPMPRMLYAMAGDGLLYHSFAKINKRTETVLFSTVVAGIVSGLMATVFNLEQLIDMMSIGTLLAYSIVALCVLLLRYQDPKPALYEPSTPVAEKLTIAQNIGRLVNVSRMKTPDKETTRISECFIAVFVVLTFITTFFIASVETDFENGYAWHVTGVVILTVLTVLPVFFLWMQPQDQPKIFFNVPWLPLIPCLSIFMNVYLMMKLDIHTWIRFLVWLLIGAIIYIFYSIPNSVEGKKMKIAKHNEKILKKSNSVRNNS